MDELTLSERRRGLEFANRITRLAQDAPDELAERALHSVASRLRRHYGWTKRLKKLHIVKAARKNGGVTINEILTEWKWDRKETFLIVKELCDEGWIVRKKIIPGGDRDKGGRPYTLLEAV